MKNLFLVAALASLVVAAPISGQFQFLRILFRSLKSRETYKMSKSAKVRTSLTYACRQCKQPPPD